ncbi:beta-xylosidase [Streptomyces sp. NPDC049879]|uniref:beta-xylosidase n=1 Tax=Streptomyces sp. NPDC049879 TaxID=3365598 RepID=UPI0037A913C7
MPRPPARKRRLRATTTLLTLLSTALAVAVSGPGTAQAAAPRTVTVDFAASVGPAEGVGSGFLYGLTEDGAGPDDSLLAPLAPRSARGGGARLDGGGWAGDGYAAGSGYQRRVESALDQARRLSTPPYDATYDLLVSDVWGADTTQAADTVYPCTNGDCANWEQFVERLARDVTASGLDVRFDIWNEPAGAFFPPGFNTEQYYRMWDSAVRTLRRVVPDAEIVGPSLWDFSPNNIAPFLDHTKAAGTLPTILNWHFSNDPAADAQTARGLLSERGITGVGLTMNEYIHAHEQHAGFSAWYLARIARSGIDSASHAIWDECCAAGLLDGLLTRGGDGALRPTGRWWVYRSYAELTGDLVRADGSGTTDAVAAVDPARHRAAVLIGDSGGDVPEVNLTLDGLTAAGIPGLSQVTVQRIPDASPLGQPETVTSQFVGAGQDTVELSFAGQAAQDAFFVTVTPYSAQVTGDAAVTAPADTADFTYGVNWGRTDGVPDMYQGTANWSWKPGSTAVVRFAGTQLSLFAVRDVDQARMLVSVDGSPPTLIDNYLPVRRAQSSVWTSPRLPRGPHTVVITVAEGRNPASVGASVALDSVLVTR